MRVLLTNDDGIKSPGLRVLYEELAAAGHEVMIAAPARNYSGAGTSLGVVADDSEIRFEEDQSFESAVAALSVEAPPCAIVLAMSQTHFKHWRPDYVVSGINNGYNTGRAALHSGTLSAALTANSLGFNAVAVSTASAATHGLTIGGVVVRHIVSTERKFEGVLNINVPDIARPQGIVSTTTEGLSVTDVEYRLTDSMWKIRKVSSTEGFTSGSDSEALREGIISVSSVVGQEDLGDLDDLYEALKPNLSSVA